MTTVASLTSIFSSDIEYYKYRRTQLNNSMGHQPKQMSIGIQKNINIKNRQKNRKKQKQMQQLIHEAYATKKWDVICQIFHNKAELLEIQYALGIEDFFIFVSQFEMIIVSQHEGVELTTGEMCYFVTGGLFAKKIQKSKEPRNRRNCNRKAILSNDVRSPRNFTTPLPKQHLTTIEDFLCPQTKSIGYYYTNQQSSTVLRLRYAKLEPSISQKLGQYFANKLKFLNKISIFKQMPKNIIQENLEKFRFNKISFNDLIYSENLRPTTIFVLMKGEVIVESAKKSPGIIIKPPNILGDSKCCHTEQARCLTEYCVCFRIDKADLENIFKRKAFLDQKQFQVSSTTSSMGMLRARYFRQFHILSQQNSSQLLQSNMITTPDELPGSSLEKMSPFLHNHRQSHRKLGNLGCDKEKKQRIKEHFSNFLSDKFKEYSSKLEKEKNFNECKQTPVLYQLKPLCQSSPNYQQMQARLKKQRLKKILQLKQNLQRSNSSKSILRISQNGTTCRNSYRGENDCIDAKIQRNLNYKISKQINRRYGNRTKLMKIV